mmetsp:Transcript_7009/g.21932  ORF Transcript_7009/g.21932 Transcript_7009/m.21932 type:complete len:226 (-) Transcript_7009:770-1447(-)
MSQRTASRCRASPSCRSSCTPLVACSFASASCRKPTRRSATRSAPASSPSRSSRQLARGSTGAGRSAAPTAWPATATRAVRTTTAIPSTARRTPRRTRTRRRQVPRNRVRRRVSSAWRRSGAAASDTLPSTLSRVFREARWTPTWVAPPWHARSSLAMIGGRSEGARRCCHCFRPSGVRATASSTVPSSPSSCSSGCSRRRSRSAAPCSSRRWRCGAVSPCWRCS